MHKDARRRPEVPKLADRVVISWVKSPSRLRLKYRIGDLVV
jgi:hypothetical protein